ncbi:unnamed protein product [Cuscuta epithymum]|uniref:Uncharacterized protein n=1 Tax=Cuscuta epithymum TaxID=186058 RepID=A0AAV0D2W8_9ASTE|nr:unnamed protein product [Cuscuta epithymum]
MVHEQISCEEFSGKHSNSECDLISMGRNHSHQNDFSISGNLLQVDIDHSASSEKSFNSIKDNISEPVPEIDSSLVHIKDFFQITMSQGVDSLSQFLIKEFERILASSFNNRGKLEERLVHEEKDTRYANPNFSRDFFSDDQDSEAYEQFCTHSGDDFLGHASESGKRTPISSMEDLWDSDMNQDICNKALLVTRENCLPTENLNTQIKIYRKTKQRSHLMRTRSQTRMEF